MAEVKKPASKTAAPSAKTVQMNTKPTYEQLEQICQRQQQQLHAIANELNRQNLSNAYKRLDYLFKVIEYSDAFTQEFYDSCVAEIEEMMKLPENGENNNKKDGSEAEQPD